MKDDGLNTDFSQDHNGDVAASLRADGFIVEGSADHLGQYTTNADIDTVYATARGLRVRGIIADSVKTPISFIP